MKLKLLYAFAFVFTFSIYNASAQSQKKQLLKVINYGENIKAPLTLKELSFIKEAYKESEKYILNNPQRVKDIKHILRNRVYLKEYKNKDLSSVKLLSTLAINNKDLVTSISFNPKTFNVLNYGFNFYSKSKNTMTYRIDNTNYLISIKPQH